MSPPLTFFVQATSKPPKPPSEIKPSQTKCFVRWDLPITSFPISEAVSAVWVNDTSTFTADIHAQGYDGLLGLGPNDSSVVRKKLKKASSADTLLQRIFSADKVSDNYISILLSRKKNSTDLTTGQFTVSEIVPGLENITSMPKLDVDKVNRLLKAGELTLRI